MTLELGADLAQKALDGQDLILRFGPQRWGPFVLKEGGFFEGQSPIQGRFRGRLIRLGHRLLWFVRGHGLDLRRTFGDPEEPRSILDLDLSLSVGVHTPPASCYPIQWARRPGGAAMVLFRKRDNRTFP